HAAWPDSGPPTGPGAATSTRASGAPTATPICPGCAAESRLSGTPGTAEETSIMPSGWPQTDLTPAQRGQLGAIGLDPAHVARRPRREVGRLVQGPHVDEQAGVSRSGEKLGGDRAVVERERGQAAPACLVDQRTRVRQRLTVLVELR